MEFGYKMRLLRNEKGLGLREFAKLIDMSASYLSNIERGSVPPPTADKVKIIADALDGDVEELLQLANRFDMKELETIRRNARRLDTAEKTIKFLVSAMNLEDDDNLGGISGIFEIVTGERILNPAEKFMGNSFKTVKFILDLASKPDEGNNRQALEIRRDVAQAIFDYMGCAVYPSEDSEVKLALDEAFIEIFHKYPRELCEEVVKNEQLKKLYLQSISEKEDAGSRAGASR
jgi:transcriptional regulator with XRE-family HTH domain